VFFDSLVSHFVDGDGHVTGLDGTRVHVTVILGDEVDVMEHEALERVLLQSLHERDVHDTRLVERVLAELQQSSNKQSVDKPSSRDLRQLEHN